MHKAGQLQDILAEQTNYDVRFVSSAFEAGIECEKFRPHVMLLDIHLADGDGNWIARAIRDNDDLQVTKLIAMSGKLTDGQVAQLTHQGFDGSLRQALDTADRFDLV